jgi:hypothetical protein
MPATQSEIAAFRTFLTSVLPSTSKASTVSQNVGHLAGITTDLNLVPSPPSLRFIETNVNDLLRFIETGHNERNPTKPWSDSTIVKKLTALSAFANVGRGMNPPQVTNAVYDRIKTIMMTRTSAQNIQRSQQTMSVRQEKNWVPMAQIEALAKELIDRFIYFYNAKRRITAASTDRERNIIRDALIAQLYVLEVPTRSQPYCDAIIENLPRGIPAGRLAKGKKNFINVSNPKKIVVGCCDDKNISKDDDDDDDDNNDENLYTKPDSWELKETTSDLIMMSLKVWDRSHLFGNGPVSNSTFAQMVQRCFTWPAGVSEGGVAVPEKVVGLQLLRTIYASTWYATNPGAPQRPGENTTRGEAELARRMRHKPSTQRTDYLKFVDDVRRGDPAPVAAAREPPCEGEFVYSTSVAAQAARVRYAVDGEAIRKKNLERYHEDPQTVNQRRYLRKIQMGERVKKSTMDKWGIYCVDGQMQT